MSAGDGYFDAREMYMLHRMFRREFGLMSGLVAGVRDGDRERVQAVADHLAFVSTALHNHHHFEDDQVWPVVLERGSADIAPHVHQVQDQHEKIEVAAAEVAEAATSWRGDAASGSRERLAAALDVFVPLLVEHMSFEEENVVPVMERTIPGVEWNRMIQAAAADLVPTDMPLEFGMMMYEGDPEIVDGAIANMPEELRAVIRQMAGTAFTEHAQRIHGTPTPPRSTEV